MSEKKTKKDINEFVFTGYIIGRNETKYSMNILFRCNPKVGTRTKQSTITIRVFDKEMKAKLNAIPLREKVSISGFVRTTPFRDEFGRVVPPVSKKLYEHNEERKKSAAEKKGEEYKIKPYREQQYFVATSVESVPESVPDENIILISGVVEASAVTPAEMIRLTVRTTTSQSGTSDINTFIFPKKDVDYLSIMKANQRVNITAHCGVRGKNTEEGMEYIESIDIDDITL